MEGFGTVMLDRGIWADFDMENCCHGNARKQIKTDMSARGAGGGAQSLGAGPAAYQPNTVSYLTVGGCGGVVSEGDVGGTAVLQRGQLLFSVTRTLFGTLQMLPEFHNLLDETGGGREESEVATAPPRGSCSQTRSGLNPGPEVRGLNVLVDVATRPTGRVPTCRLS